MKNRKLIIIIIFLLLFRIFLLIQFAPPCCSSDEGVYHSIAKNLVNKNLFLVTKADVDGMWKEEVYGAKPPLYPFFLAAIYKIFSINYITAKVFQIILAAVTGLLIYRVSKLLFSERIAVISLLIFSFFWEIASMSTLLLSENLYWFLMVVLVYALLKMVQEHKNSAWIILSGLTLGLLTLTKPMSLSLIIPIGFWIYIYRINFKTAATYILAIAFFSLLMITPWIIRNYQVYKQFVFIYTDGGINVWMGNSWGSGGTYRVPKPEDINQTPVLLTTGVGQEVERDNFYYSKARSYIIEDPLGTLDKGIRKIFATFALYRPASFLPTRFRGEGSLTLPRSLGIDAFHEFLVSYQFAVFSLLFFLGMIIIMVKQKIGKYLWLLIFLFAWHLLSIITTHFEYRYIMQMYPFMIPFSAMALHVFLKVFKS